MSRRYSSIFNTIWREFPSAFEQANVIYVFVFTCPRAVSKQCRRLSPYTPQNKDSFFIVSGDFEGHAIDRLRLPYVPQLPSSATHDVASW
jgi:hypothetical protein